MKKAISLILALLMILSVVPVTALAANDYTINSTTSTDDYYNLISKTDWDIAPGITESQIVLDNDDGNYRQVLYVMEADLNNEYVKVINSYNGMVPQYGDYKTGVMSEQAAYAEANGYGNVVGAMNTTLSWYSGYSADRVGEPLGFIMLDAETLFDPANCGYEYGKVGFPSVLVINKDFDENGNPRPANIPKVEMPQITSSADLDGWEDQVIPVSSGYIVKDGVNQAKTPNHKDSAPRSVVGIKPDGTVVIMVNDGRQSPYSIGMSMYELAEVMLDLGCSYAVNCDGGGSTTWLSERPGEGLKVNNSPSDGAERPTTTGILFISTAPADGVFARAHITADSDYYTPGSEVKFNAIGTDFAGTPAEIPEDVKWQLADASFGTVEDGVFVSNGKEGKVTVQMVYNEEVVGEASINVVLPDIAFKNDTIVIGYGDSMMLPIEVTTNEGRNTVAYAPGDIVYTLSDENLGTIDGDRFTACDADAGLTNGTITAVICGQNDKTVSAAIRFGKASEIVYDYENGEFLVDEDPHVNPAEGEPYGWFIQDTRWLGHHAYRFYAKKNYTPIGYDIPAEVYLVDRDNGKVKNGNYAMGIDIDWTYVTASCHGQMDVLLPESLDLTDATRVGLWMYIPAELVTASMQLRAGFRTKSGSSTAVTAKITDMMGTNSGVENGGWFYFSWEVLDTYKSFEYFEINSHYTAGEGNYNYYQNVTYYVDDITVDYSDATIDRENPYFTSMTIADDYTNGVEISGQTITTNTITLMAQAYENTTKTNATGLNRNSVKVYIDGSLSKADIAVSVGGTISVSNVYLNDGVHTIVMEISDNQGNVGNIVRKLVVNTDKSDVRLEVPAPTVPLLPTGSIYWVNLVADNLAAIDSVTTTINLDYVNSWELEGMEVAYGFTAEYYVNNHNDAVITFTRTGNEVADTTILAKLPIRIWMAKGWMDDSGIRKDYISNDPAKQDKYHILTPHAMWYSDGTRDYRLVVSAEAGAVTYVDGSTMTFSANETVIQTEMNRYYTNASRQGKWSFHICTAGEATDKAATCTESGYTGRVFCVGCACGSVENLNAECDTHNGCGSVIDWGTTVPATGHTYEIIDGKYACACGEVKVVSGLITIGDGLYYVINGQLKTGWMVVGANYYYFDPATYAAVDGEQKLADGYRYTFENNILVKGQLVSNEHGTLYRWGGTWLADKWFEYEGNMYFVKQTAYIATGPFQFRNTKEYYLFSDEGIWINEPAGLYTHTDGRIYGIKEDGTLMQGLNLVDGNYYYFSGTYGSSAIVGQGYYVSHDNGLGFVGWQEFDAEGKMVVEIFDPDKNGLVEENGGIFYYVDGEKTAAGLIEYEGYYYYIRSNGQAATGYYWTTNTNDLLPQATYLFGEDGKMLNPPVDKKNGLVNEDGTWYYYEDGVKVAAGLIEYEGNYYYIRTGGVVATGYYWITHTHNLMPQGTYLFGEDGKMLNPPVAADPLKNGLYNEEGSWYYYVDGVKTAAGLIEYEGYYYYIRTGGVAATGYYWITYTNGLLPQATYLFGEDGKMLNPPVDKKNGMVNEDGTWYYYEDGVKVAAGLIEYNGNYYYVRTGGVVATGYYWITHTHDLMPQGTYLFAEDGKMVDPPIAADPLKNGMYNEDGVWYYYVDGVKTAAGLIEYEGNYYYIRTGGVVATGYYWITYTNDLLPQDTYLFAEDGKMLNPPAV